MTRADWFKTAFEIFLYAGAVLVLTYSYYNRDN